MNTYEAKEICRCGARVYAAGPSFAFVEQIVGSFRVEHALCRSAPAEFSSPRVDATTSALPAERPAGTNQSEAGR